MNHISQYLPETELYVRAASIGTILFTNGSSPLTALAIGILCQLPRVLDIEEQACRFIEKSLENLFPSRNIYAAKIPLFVITLLGFSTCSSYGGGLLGSALFGTHSIPLIQAGIGGACNLALSIDNELGFEILDKATSLVDDFIEPLLG